MMYGSWYMKHDRQNFLSFWAIFYPFIFLQSRKSKFWKNEKSSRRYYHLHNCTINDNHMLYGSWDINCNRQIFFVIFGHFLPFYPPNSPKNEISQNWKKLLEISSFYTNVPKTMIIGYTVPEIWSMTDVIIIIMGNFLPFYPSNSQKNENVKKI